MSKMGKARCAPHRALHFWLSPATSRTVLNLFKRNDGPSAGRAQVGRAVGQMLDANPAVERVIIADVQVYYCANFLDAPRCKEMIQLIDADRRPSTLLTDRPDETFRTSESCDLNRWDPRVRSVDEAIAALLGIDPAKGETLQGQRYAPGQQFRAHHDFFFRSESYWRTVTKEGGQRTWTAMVYLNDVVEGGETWFPQAGIRVAPKRGLLLMWNNMRPDGSPNLLTVHEGMPVVRGKKYIVTKWFREANWLAHPSPR